MADDIEKQDIPEAEHLRSSTEQELSASWDASTITNDFIFCKVMQDKELLSELVHMILPDLKFKDLLVQAQKPIEIGMDIHGVRFDIFALDENDTAIEIEMQVLNTGALPKRMRFYSALADTQILEKGVVYSKLKDSYIIMICPFDQYELGLHRYTFTNRCHEADGLEMGDGTTKIVLSAVGTADDVDPNLRAFLDYVAGKSVDDEYVKKLDAAVAKAKANKEWRKEYMTLMMRDLENQEIGEKNKGDAIAEKMLVDGEPTDKIIKYTGVSLETLQEMADRLGLTLMITTENVEGESKTQ